MTRKHCPRRPIQPLPPRGLRPKLDADQLVDLGLVHACNLDDLVVGRATETTLQDWVACALTWSRAADLLGAGVAEMTEQLMLTTAVLDRYRHTGRIELTSAEYATARAGLQVMDELARLVDRATAVEAARWSEGRMRLMSAGARP
ncbi:hypothetical protein [Leptothrix discophora]|uniref:Uncharacterized protein n=1 Tax=Leptothrix discophora TaxID=89 RepID=A0ABT9G1M0_LEPDI|nr:hypothetical protein [Leptothrix discophora]MDP4300382.1 hypothetical protein [Leptothrix discophora]